MKTNHFAKSLGLLAFSFFSLSNLTHAQLALLSPAEISMSETFNGSQYNYLDGKWMMADGGSSYEIATDQITLKFTEGATEVDRANIASENNLIFLREASTGWADFEIISNAGSIFSLAETLQESPHIETVEITTYGEFFQVPNDASFASQWAFQDGSGVDINMPEAWDLSTGSNTVKVAVIDSGVDFEINDLGMGADGYDNLYVNAGEDAWSDPTDPTTGNGIDDDGNGLIDDWRGWHFTNNSNDSRSMFGHYHGTGVSSVIAAKTNNNEGMAGIAGGWNSEGVEIIALSVEHPNPAYGILSSSVDDAIVYAVDQGANVINMSFGIGTSIAIQSALQYARDEGVVIVAATGNGNLANGVVFPASHPYTIAVGGSNPTDQRWNTAPTLGSNYGSKVDVVAPAELIPLVGANNIVSSHSGTSFAAPIVSGVVALMLSANPCLSPDEVQHILQATAVKAGGYNYDWNYTRPGHSKEFGHGRIDAFAAVAAAQNLISNSLPDLAIHDHISDYGADAGYTFTWDFDESPDIWARNADDGIVNQFPEEIEFTADPANPAYIYVRIWNHSCVEATDQTLEVFSSAAGSNGDWPSGWTNWMEGGQQITSVSVPSIPPGGYEIVTIPWVMIFSPNQCLIARVESPLDPITDYPGDLAQEVYQNNNIGLRNLIVNDIYPGKVRPMFEDRVVPFGTPVQVGNNQEEETIYDFEFFDHTFGEETPLSTSAELTLHFTTEGWTVFEPYLRENRNVKILGNNTVEVLSSHLYLNDISIPGKTYFPIFVGYSFLTDEIDEQLEFEYHVVQKNNEEHEVMGDHWTGGVHMYVNREEREPFSANGGEDHYITTGEPITLAATSIGEEATYNWYDEEGNLVHEGISFEIEPMSDQTYKLEVIANADGYKDYDEVSVFVNPYYIESLSPNPAVRFVTVKYETSGVETGYVKINGVNVLFNSDNYDIETARREIRINIADFPAGIYTVTLVCDGVVVDVEMLSIE